MVLTNGTTSRRLLVDSASISQTFLEESKSVSTIHNDNVIAHTFTNSKSNPSVEFSVYLTNKEDLLFNWFGFPKVADKFFITPSKILPSNFDIYLLSSGSQYKVTGVHAMSISFNMGKDGPIKLTVNATGIDMEEIPSIPSFNGLTTQSSADFRFQSLELVGSSYLGGFTLEITKDVAWRADKSLHSVLSGNIHTNTRAICNDLAISGSITNYKRDVGFSHTTSQNIQILYGDFMEVFLSPCRVFERLDLNSEVHRKISDYKLLPTTNNSYIKF